MDIRWGWGKGRARERSGCCFTVRKGFPKGWHWSKDLKGGSHADIWLEYSRQRNTKCEGLEVSWRIRMHRLGTSLVAQWLRICLPMQGTRVRALVWEDPTCRGATRPVSHNYWACALEPASHSYWACVPQLLKPTCLEPVLHNKRSHGNEKPTRRKEEEPLLAATRESPRAITKTQHSHNK